MCMVMVVRDLVWTTHWLIVAVHYFRSRELFEAVLQSDPSVDLHAVLTEITLKQIDIITHNH